VKRTVDSGYVAMCVCVCVCVCLAGVLGLDNLDYTASVLDMARSRGQLRLNAAGAGGTSTHDDSGGGGHDTGGGGGGDGGDTVGGRQRVVGGSSVRGRQGGVRLSGRRRGGHPAFRRLTMSMSPQKLRKIMDIMNAGRRR